ncbi:MAG: ATP synthase F1 subunit epsilon [Phycisphaerae bacterium]|nr:ATP synthase F1 subunit epsilon [Phycisphaerae bacterium]
MAKQTTDINLIVITPERQVLDEHTDAVVIPAHDGELGILRGRAALMCELGIGQLRYEQGGKTERVFIDGGFAQVHGDRVTVLSPRALPSGSVTAEVMSAAEQAASESAEGEPRALARQRVRAMRAVQSAD